MPQTAVSVTWTMSRDPSPIMRGTPKLTRKKLSRMSTVDCPQSAHLMVPSTGPGGNQTETRRSRETPTTSMRKKLSRTDSSVLVVSDAPLHLPMKLVRNGHCAAKPPPCPGPPIKVEEPRENKPIRQHTLSGSGHSPRQRDGAKKYSVRGDPHDIFATSSSCPNLADEENTVFVVKNKVRITKSSDGRLGSGNDKAPSSPSKSEESRSKSPKLLTVPTIFTTSYTHSKPPSKWHEKEHHSIDVEPAFPATLGAPGRQNYRHSAPELAINPSGLSALVTKDKLTKSKSYTPSVKSSQEDLSGESSHDDLLPSPVNEPIAGAVQDFLYLGNLESANNERLLCRLGISSVVDLSNVPPHKVPASKRCDVPCTCGNDWRHLQATLRLHTTTADFSDLHPSFEKVNKFIEGARKNNKKTLVFCYNGIGLGAVAVIQYLMVHRGMNLRKAVSLVMMHRSDLDLPVALRDWLQSLEKDLFKESEQSLCFEGPNAESRLPREAWVNDSDC